MTKAQFIRGYLLLTSQPWGKSYRSLAAYTDGEPSPAEIQLEFYYASLCAYHHDSWVTTCEIHAKGEHWPSLDALKLTLKHHPADLPALPAPQPICTTMEDALRERPDLLAVLKRVMA